MLTINNQKLGFPWNVLIGVPVVCFVFTLIAVVFLAVVALLLSPIALVVWLVVR